MNRYSFSNTAFPTLSFPLTPFLHFAENGGLGVVSPRDLDRNRKDDYVAAWTASIQRKLPLEHPREPPPTSAIKAPMC